MKIKHVSIAVVLLLLSTQAMATGGKTVDPAWFMSFFSLF